MKKSKFLQSSKDMLHRSFKPDKCKTSLRLVTSRSKLMRNKKEVQVKQLRREIAHLLESGQDSSARIKVEHVVREEKMMAAYELISLYSELVMTRLTIIESQKNCPIDLKEGITSLIFASPRCGDIPELVDVQKHFTAKYGKDFVTTAIELRPDCGVSRLLVEKLSAKAPDGQTKLKILTAIAEEHGIKWDPKSFGENDSTATTDFLSGPASFQAAAGHIQSPQNQPPQTPQTFQASVVHAQSPRHEPSEVSQNQVHYQPLNPEHNDRISQGTQDINSTNSEVRPMPSYSQHEATRLFGPGVTTERPAGEQSFSEDRNTFSSHGHNWNMDFKDAASAAQAAAQSADRASMAARAAAEFASRDSMKESHKSGSHSKRDSSEFHKDSSDNYAFDRNWRSDSDQMQGVKSKNPGGSPERSYQGGYDTMANYNQGNNLSSNDFVVDGSSGPSSRDAGKYSQNSTCEEEAAKSDTIAKPQYNESEYRNDVGESSDYEDVHNIQAVNFQTNMYKDWADTPDKFANPQYDEPEYLSDGQEISNSEKFHHTRAVNSVKESGTSLNLQPNIYDENSDASDFDHQSFRSHTGSDSQFGMEQGRIHTDISRTGSGNSGFAVFDNAGSEHEDVSFDTGPKYDDQGSDSDSIPSGKAAPSNIFRTPSPQDFGFDGSKSPKKSVQQSSSHGKQSSNESPVISETSVNDCKFDDQLPTKFDESDCPSSEGENSVDEVSHTSRKYLETFPGSKGHIIPSPRSSFKEQGNQGVVEKPHLKDESGDEILTHPRSEVGSTLNFKNLTGGLRHKQYALPQYINAQVDDVSSPLKNPVEASTSKMLESSASIKAHGQVNTEVKQITNNRKTLGLSHDDSDIDSSEDERPAQGSGFGREPYTQFAVKDTGTNSRSKVSVPYFESDSDEVPQSSKQTGRKDMSSGLSRRTQGTPARTPKVQPKREEPKSSDFSSGIKSAFGSYDSRSTDEPESRSSDKPESRSTYKPESRRGKGSPSSPVQSKREELDDSEYRSVNSRFSEEPESEQTRATSPGNPNVQPRLEATNDSDFNLGRKSTISSYGSQFTENTESPRRNSGQPRNSEQSSSARKSSEQKLESKVSSNQESLISTAAEHSHIFQQKENAPKTSQASQLTGNAPSKSDSGKHPSHVHPKLPDYDTFAAFFKK